MSQSDLKSLSQDELRKRLYQTFKKKGVLDSLKTQLRNQLIQDLKLRALSGESIQPPLVSGDTLLHRACNSLVADHLRRCGYEFSLSVFYPECGLEKDQDFTIHDIMQVMKISPKSELYSSLTSAHQNSSTKGFLMQILTQLIDFHLHKDGRDVYSQTTTTSPYKESIVEKMKFIDEQFEEMYPKRPKFESIEGKLSEYRREIEEQLQQEMSQKFQHFKDVELAKIKLEEREKSQKELSDLRRELEKTYQLKYDSLTSREKNAIERLQKQQEIESKEIYAQRQTLLKEIETIRNRELDLRQRIEAFELAQKLQEEKNKSVTELLRKRELDVKNIEDTFEQKLKDECLRYQIELKEEYLKKTQKVNEDDKKNREEASRLREDTIVINMKKQEMEQAISRTTQLQVEVDTLKAQLSFVTQQNENLTEKLREFAAYPLVQKEKAEMEAQVKWFKQQIEELGTENQILREKASQPSHELLSLQDEINQLESARKFEQSEFKIQREILEKQLELEIERGLEMKMQLLSREESSKRLSAQVELLEFQLRQTQQALENEVYRHPKSSLLDRPTLGFPASRIVSPDNYDEKPALKSHRLLGSSVETGGISVQRHRHNDGTRSSSPDSDLEFVATTKARIKDLEKEAEFLEEAYRNYQHRVFHTASIENYPLPTDIPSRGYLSSVPALPHHRVTFLEDNLTPQQHILLNRLKMEKYEGLLSAEVDLTPPRTKKSSARRLSSTPVSKAEKSQEERVSLDDGSYISSSHHSFNNRLSPIPKTANLPTQRHDVLDNAVGGEREQLSSAHIPAKKKLDLSHHSTPEKLHPEDLNRSDSSLHDQEDIPEQLESDLSHPSGDSVHDIGVTADVPGAAHSVLDLFGSRERSENSNKDLDRSKVTYPQEQKEESIQDSSEVQEKADDQAQASAEKVQEESVKDSNQEVNPLDRYMQLLLQNRNEDQSDKGTKEIFEDVSVEEKLSNDR
ncbi:centriole and centriolar satellite protein OFD1 [Hyla sarda]|uniref:centriole and centriolar satellite protein OFD1 n=1 Tax=Hyla sarda TaxID=327740 RepID=UPI0024C4239E|nr:centriole and centriolar satellite protein OFD1 [Hyla sarda]XP_056412231.1 centriole and centriolar satellite protein OFD1 [Hyla sarda]